MIFQSNIREAYPMTMTSTQALAERLNGLRKQKGLEPLKDPAKRGQSKIQAEIEKLEQELGGVDLMRIGTVETIRTMSERLIMHVNRVDPGDDRTEGLTYREILAMIHEKFPKAETSVECLRWYAVHMRAEGKRLPQKRPRPLVRA